MHCQHPCQHPRERLRSFRSWIAATSCDCRVFLRPSILQAVVCALALGAAVCVATLGASPDAHAEALDERAFLQRFDAFDPRAAVLAARIDIARAETAAARVRPNPSVSLDREDAFASGHGEPQNILRLQMPFDLSGRREVQVQAAEAGVRAVAAEIAHERHLLRLQAIGLYRDAAFSRQRVEVIAAGLAGVRATVEVLHKRVASGHTAGYDLERLELELGEWQERVGEAEAERDLAAQGLALLIGASQPVAAHAVVLSLPATPSAMSGANRADLRAAEAGIEQGDLEAAAARRRRIPGLSVSGGLKTQDRQQQTAVGYVVGVAVTLPLFDRGEAELIAATARKREAQARQAALAVQVPVAVRLAEQVLQRRVEQAKHREQTWLPRIDRLAQKTEAAWREGDRPVFELLDVWRSARDGRLRLLDLREAASRGELDLWRAVGRLPWEIVR